MSKDDDDLAPRRATAAHQIGQPIEDLSVAEITLRIDAAGRNRAAGSDAASQGGEPGRRRGTVQIVTAMAKPIRSAAGQIVIFC
jgi:hypothetical protein